MLSLVFFLLVASSPAVLAASGGGDDHGLTHMHLYVHETYTPSNATLISVSQSPLGANASFGSVGVLDDELRVGRDRSSQLVGRYQGIIVGTSREVSPGYLSSVTFVFTAGEYAGSTLSMHGPVLGFSGIIERAVVGGTGKFRLAQGYTFLKSLAFTPETGVYQIDLFVLMHRGKY